MKKIIIKSIASITFIIVCFAFNVQAQTPISTFITTTSSTSDSYIYNANGAPESNFESNNYNIAYGNASGSVENIMTLVSIESNGITYDYDPFETQVSFRRVDNTVFTGTRDILFFYGTNTGNNLRLRAPYEANMEVAFTSNTNILRGSDNVFSNEKTSSGGENYNNIERLDVIIKGGEFIYKADAQGFSVLERGEANHHDPFVVAVITDIDANGIPIEYSNIIRIESSDYGTTNPYSGMNGYVLRRDSNTGNLQYSAALGTQGIGGVFFKFSDFGIADGQKVYGYSVGAADFPASGTSADFVDYTNSTFFPKNTLGAASHGNHGGLDMIGLTGFYRETGLLFENYYPATGYGTLAYEDLWPGKGDYDFNDLVVDYRFIITTNSLNNVVKAKGTFIIQAIGASFENGFGFQFSDKIDPADINVTGSKITESYINLNANGTEAGQSKATIIVFDNASDHMPFPGGGAFINTEIGAPYVTPDTTRINFYFPADKYSYSDLSIEEFNPFLIIDGKNASGARGRGYEVHLPYYPATDLADASIFGTEEDATNPGSGYYYLTAEALPWALNIYEKFYCPIEKVDIVLAHLKFAEWAMSGGTIYPDWYKNISGYRDNSKIYFPPGE